MTINRMPQVLLVIVCVLGISCKKFSPTGSHFDETVQLLDPPRIAVNLSTASDTIGAWGNANFSYGVITERQVPTEVRFLVDSTMVYRSDDITGSFFIQTNDFTDGVHSLTMEIIVSTNSGTIADRLGAERFIGTNIWTLVIANAPPETREIVSMQRKDGMLEVIWSRYDQVNFQKYVLESGHIQHDRFVSVEQFDITDQNAISRLDSSYVGGSRSYRIRVEAATGISVGPVTTFTDDTPSFTQVEALGPQSMKLTWSRSMYPGNFGSYQIWRDKARLGGPPAFVVDSITDTTLIDEESIFGNTVVYTIETAPKPAFTSGHQSVQHDMEGRLGMPNPGFYEATYNVALNSVYLKTGTELFRLDDQTFTVQASRTVGIGFVRRNAYGISSNGMHAYVSIDSTIFRVNP